MKNPHVLMQKGVVFSLCFSGYVLAEAIPDSERYNLCQNKKVDNIKENNSLHPLELTGFTIEDLENGLVGMDGSVTFDECGSSEKKISFSKTSENRHTHNGNAYRSDSLEADANLVVLDPSLLTKSLIIRPRTLGVKMDEKTISIRFKRPPLENIQLELDKVALTGGINSDKDYRKAHKSLLDRRQKIMKKYMAEKVSLLSSAGVTVLSFSELSASAKVLISQEKIKEMASHNVKSKDNMLLLKTGSNPILGISGIYSITKTQEMASASLDGETLLE